MIASTEETLTGGGRSTVTRSDDVVLRPSTPSSPTIIALLRHLEQVGYAYAPRIVGSGFTADGREAVRFIEGEFVHPGPWAEDALPLIGRMLRQLHDATASFVSPAGAMWRPWFGRSLGTARVLGHGDTGQWNIVSRNGLPVALIDWETAGPVDPIIELAQACWLNAQLFDDDLGERLGLGSLEQRAKKMRMLLDGYGLTRDERRGFVETMADFVILCARNEAIEAGVTEDTRDPTPLWAITWRTRSAGWIVQNRTALERALV
jgi:hypothetical protein